MRTFDEIPHRLRVQWIDKGLEILEVLQDHLDVQIDPVTSLRSFPEQKIALLSGEIPFAVIGREPRKLEDFASVIRSDLIREINIRTVITALVRDRISAGREYFAPWRLDPHDSGSFRILDDCRECLAQVFRMIHRHQACRHTARIRIFVVQPDFHAAGSRFLDRDLHPAEKFSRQIWDLHALSRMDQEAVDPLLMHFADLSPDLVRIHVPIPEPERLYSF